MLERGFQRFLVGRIDDLYRHVLDPLAWREEKLMRFAGGNVNDIAGFVCDPGAALILPLNPLPCISLGAVGCGSIAWPPYTRVASPLWTIMTSALV
jgi:hypothetical protein